ncbi:hypothetical protein HZC20_02445 [Candidatus Peregrinibacteria bacterium]|nr:hypothetical protein [Candidatus Peregrinibacteria bacterium]
MSACGGGAVDKAKDGAGSGSSPASTSTASTKDPTNDLTNDLTSMIGFLTDLGCVTAKYDGNAPDNQNSVVYEKYGIADDAAFNTAAKLLSPIEVASIKVQSVTKIEAQCKDDFVKGGVSPEVFMDNIFENALK